MSSVRAVLLACALPAALIPAAPDAHAQGYTLSLLATFNGANGSFPEGRLILSGSTLYGTTETGGAGGDGTVFAVPTTGGAPTVLASFGGANGNRPRVGLTPSPDGSTLYGTTEFGGAYGDGTVFSLPISGGAPTVLANFSFSDTNGANPQAALTVGPGGILYGVALDGGANGDGTVFALIPNAAPEPSQTAALALGALGLSALALRARRRPAVS